MICKIDGIVTAIKELKTNKASGFDYIVNEYLKCTVSQLLPLYVKLFDTILDTGIIPESWTIGIIRPIYKLAFLSPQFFCLRLI